MKKMLYILVLLFITLTLFTSYKLLTDNEKKINIEEKLSKPNKGNSNTKNIDYKEFKTLYNNDKVYTIAITSNSSNISKKFLELINTMSINYNDKIYILNISTMSKKDKAKFYNLNSRFKELETDYIINIYNKKIISERTFNKGNINTLIDYYKKGE